MLARRVELYSIFCDYTEDGTFMSKAGFLEILRDMKILSKNDFPVHYATLIFSEQTVNLERKRVNFIFFRETFIPIVALQKKFSIETLIVRLCHIDNHNLQEEPGILQHQVLLAAVTDVVSLFANYRNEFARVRAVA